LLDVIDLGAEVTLLSVTVYGAEVRNPLVDEG
jgi:hypothetical protein